MDDELQVLELPWLVAVGRYLRISPVGILACLNELFLFFLKDVMAVNDTFRREFA